MKIIFYNHQHNGDVFVSRSFVKFFIEIGNFSECYYVHKNDNAILKDINVVCNNESLKYIDQNIAYFIKDDEIYLNTWYASNKQTFNGCNFNSLYNHFNLFSKEVLNIDLDIYNKEVFLPNYYITNTNIDNYFNNCIFDKKIYISNNDVLSLQSNNFNFNPIISYLCENYPNYLFIVTNKKNIINDKLDDVVKSRIANNVINLLHYDNLIYSEDIIGINGNNLLENSYLSTKCDVIVGRNSGCYTFSYNKENLLNQNIKFISISENRYESIWYDNRKSDVIWTNNYNDVGKFIKNNI